MKEDVKERWCQALRSGIYGQGNSRFLRRHSSSDECYLFSPVGVLADILIWGR